MKKKHFNVLGMLLLLLISYQVTNGNNNKYKWSEDTIYTEHDVAILNGTYYRAKWWTRGFNPSTKVKEVWDSPWEKIDKKQFSDLIAGIFPPHPQDAEFQEVVERGYIEEWHINDKKLPKGIKKAFNAGSVNGKNILDVQNGQGALDIFSSQIDEAKWNQLFPRRRGSKDWRKHNNGKVVDDYYSFENFSEAIRIIGEYAYMRDIALEGTSRKGKETTFERIYVLHKPTGKVRLISKSRDYFAPDVGWLTGRYHVKKVIDYAAFGLEGSENDKKRVIAGFLAHASHETSASGPTTSGSPFNKNLFTGATFPDYITTTLPGELAWSLYYNEEVAHTGSTSSPYSAPHDKLFPPTSGQSYHGRGAFQLSWNYNYGLASAIFFGDSNVLLDNPDMITDGGTVASNPNGDTWRQGDRIEGGTMAFLTSLMFWLTPQGSKPSQQDIMILNRDDGRYVSGNAKLKADNARGTPGYGWTINIMNGGYEAGKSWEEGKPNYDARVARRVKHYRFFTQALGGNNVGEVLDTLGKRSY